MCNLFEVHELLVVLKFRILLEKYENKEMLENKNKKKGKSFLHFHFRGDATLSLSRFLHNNSDKGFVSHSDDSTSVWLVQSHFSPPTKVYFFKRGT